MSMKRRRAASALRKAEERIDADELEDSLIADLRLVFRPAAPITPDLIRLRDAFLDRMDAEPPPDGLRPAIATGPKREPVSRQGGETLLANVLDLERSGRKTLAVSLDKNAYASTPLSSSGFVNLLRLASHKSRGMFTFIQGFHDRRPGGKSFKSRIRPTRECRKFVRAYMGSLVVREDDLLSEPHALVAVRHDDADVPPEDWTDETRSALEPVEQLLAIVNQLLGEFRIQYDRDDDGETGFLFPILHAIYNGDEHHGGRIYTGRNGHQALSKRERSTITIEDEPTVELDFGGLHVRILYHLAGRHFPLHRDPYLEVLHALDIDPAATIEAFPSIRDDLKTTFLALLNGTGTAAKAVANANYRLFHGEDGAKRAETWAAAGLIDDPTNPDAERVLGAFQTAHAPIRDEFMRGSATILHNIDAAIVRRVLFALSIEGHEGDMIPVLPVHDSFVVPVEFEDVLHNAMRLAYRAELSARVGQRRRFAVPIR